MTEKCTICLEELHRDLGTAVPCGHVFHRECFGLLKAETTNDVQEGSASFRPRCPCCKKKVKKFHNIFMTVLNPEVCMSMEKRKSDCAIQTLTRENFGLQKRLRELKTLSKDQSDLLFRVLPRFDHVEARYEKLKLEKRALQQQLDHLEDENVEVISQWNDSETKLSTLEQERNSLELKLEKANNENRELKAVWDTLEDRFQKYLRKSKASKAHKEKLKKAKTQVSTMKRQEEVLNTKLLESQRQVFQLKRQLKKLTRRMKSS